MTPAGPGTVSASLRAATRAPYWLEDPARPESLPALEGPAVADLVVVGGGYLGLWTALLAHQRDPDLEVLVLEAETCGHAASGRNGGFCEASLTHGFGNGRARWPGEMDQLLEMGRDNLDAIEHTVEELAIDCDFVRAGSFAVATRPHEVDWLREEYDAMRAHGLKVTWLDAEEMRERVDSPTYLAAMHDPDAAILEPARLAWGLRDACLSRGIRIAEGTPATELRETPHGVAVGTPEGDVLGRQVVLATNAYRPLLRRLRLMTVPVWDYALMTEPLSETQRAAVGWHGREGIGDAGNQFHYYRTTRDGRILWGGYDAIYHYGSLIAPEHEQREETFEVLARNFATTFPQLADVAFSHAWGGVIDTCTRFTAFYGTAVHGRVGYALGFTGLGVGATRFAAEVVLDLLAGLDTPRTRLEMVRKRPVPFPPEPARWAGVELTRRSLASMDANGGKQNVWLKAMDRLGLGFDS